jgi:NAD(P)-dependent dehydrogenase (short-subunit alcohol dehydrogenase family)
MSRLQGKVALITGGTSGIGLAAARLFAAEGARVFVTGSTESSVAVARDLLGPSISVIRSDAGDLVQIDALLARVSEQAGDLDILFVNAGITGSHPLAELDEALFDRIFRVNVKGPYFTVRAAIPRMRAGGTIILNGSISASIGMPGTAVYAGSKAALRALGRVAAAELAARQIRVNVLSPGPTETGILEKNLDAAAIARTKAYLGDKIPLGRMAHPDEIARAALFLASEDSSFMTGEEIVVDGGMTRV